MLKSWFPFSFQEDPATQNGASKTAQAAHAPAAHETNKELEPLLRNTRADAADLAKYLSFEQVYGNAAVKPPRIPYGILKVADMVDSPHLSGMSPEAKRCALLMALDAAGVEKRRVSRSKYGVKRPKPGAKPAAAAPVAAPAA